MIKRGNCIIPGISERIFDFLENLIEYSTKSSDTILSYVYGDELKVINMSYTVCGLPGDNIIVITSLKRPYSLSQEEKEYLTNYFKKLVYYGNRDRELKRSFCKNVLGIENNNNIRIIFIDNNNKVLINLKRNS